MTPLAKLEVHVGQLIFLLLSLLCVSVAGWLLFRYVLARIERRLLRATIVGIAICTLSAAGGLWGNVAPMFLLPLVGALIFAERGQMLRAGLCTGAIGLLRPQLIWLIPVFAIGARQWRMVAGMAAGGVVLALSTLLILGRDFMDWPRSVLPADVAGNNSFTFGLPGWLGYTFSSTTLAWVSCLVMVIAVAAFAWRYGGALSERPDLVLAIGICLSLVVSPHVETWYYILLALPLCVLARTHPHCAIIAALWLDAVQFSTLGYDGDYGPPIQYWMILAPILVSTRLWYTNNRRARHTLSVHHPASISA